MDGAKFPVRWMESKVIGYIQNQMLSDTDQIEPQMKKWRSKSDATVLDYPEGKMERK